MTNEPNRDERKQKLLWRLESTLSITEACKKENVPHSLYYYWLANDAEFAAKAELVRALAVETVNDLGYQAIIKGLEQGNLGAFDRWERSKRSKMGFEGLEQKDRDVARGLTDFFTNPSIKFKRLKDLQELSESAEGHGEAQ